MLVTRPQPDNEATAALLRAKGVEVLLAPMLRFEPVAFDIDPEVEYGGVIVSSANSFRAMEGKPSLTRLLNLPLFAVGSHTAEAAQAFGFKDLIVAAGDAISLRDTIIATVRDRNMDRSKPLLWLVGADMARDIATELRGLGFNVVAQTVYKMVPVHSLPDEVCSAFAGSRIDTVMHYSGRSARSFLDAARAAGIEISALAIVHCCISEAVASVVREAGATRVIVARAPSEAAMFEVLDRALGSPS